MMFRKLSEFASDLLARRADVSRVSVTSDVDDGDISAAAFHGAPGFYGAPTADPDPPLKHYDMSAVLRDLPVTMTSLRQWILENRQVLTADGQR